MKKLFLLLGFLSLLTACSNDDSGSGDPFAELSTASVADAAIIYKRTTATRAASDDAGYWKIDHAGNETRIVLYDKEGKPSEVQIESIEKLNDRLLLIVTEYRERMIADLETEKLYQAPANLTLPVKEGPDGKLYFVGEWIDAWNNQMLYRLDPVNYTVEQVLPDGQKCNRFLVNKGSAIYYTPEEHLLSGGGKFKMPSGRIYPNSDNTSIIFLSGNNDFYAVDPDYNTLSKWEQRSDNELEKVSICPLSPEEYLGLNRSIISIVKNMKNGHTVIVMDLYVDNIPGQTGYGLFEFDGSQIVRTKTYDQYNDERRQVQIFWEHMRTQEVESLAEGNLFFVGMNAIVSLNLTDYSITYTPYTFPAGAYELYETTMDEANRRLLFTALRYEDGKVVIGAISAKGEISIVSEKESGSKVVNLIALN